MATNAITSILNDIGIGGNEQTRLINQYYALTVAAQHILIDGIMSDGNNTPLFNELLDIDRNINTFGDTNNYNVLPVWQVLKAELGILQYNTITKMDIKQLLGLIKDKIKKLNEITMRDKFSVDDDHAATIDRNTVGRTTATGHTDVDDYDAERDTVGRTTATGHTAVNDYIADDDYDDERDTIDRTTATGHTAVDDYDDDDDYSPSNTDEVYDLSDEAAALIHETNLNITPVDRIDDYDDDDDNGYDAAAAIAAVHRDLDAVHRDLDAVFDDSYKEAANIFNHKNYLKLDSDVVNTKKKYLKYKQKYLKLKNISFL